MNEFTQVSNEEINKQESIAHIPLNDSPPVHLPSFTALKTLYSIPSLRQGLIHGDCQVGLRACTGSFEAIVVKSIYHFPRTLL